MWAERERVKFPLTPLSLSAPLPLHRIFSRPAPALLPLIQFSDPLRSGECLGVAPSWPSKTLWPQCPRKIYIKGKNGLFLYHLRLTYPRMSQVKDRNKKILLAPLTALFYIPSPHSENCGSACIMTVSWVHLITKQDMSVGPSTHVACERDARTPVTLHLLAVQQILHHWLFPGRVQGGRSLAALEEERVGRWWAELKNYRPVLNLPFISKLLEKVVQVRIQAFFDSNGLMPVMQSAYRRFHSTETAVTKVFNDLLRAADGEQLSALCLPYLTAAFDTVDHELLLLRLQRQFGLRGIVLDWFRSYLSGRSFRVVLNGRTSSIIYIICSVPQGSVLGPLLFIVYTADLTTIAEKHGVSLHAFADDTQLYLHCRRGDIASAATQLERCITDVGCWMSGNRLILNTDKTELLWVGPRYSLHQHVLCLPELHLGHDSVVARDHVRLQGATILSDLSLDRHVSVVSASGFYWLWQLGRWRRSLDTQSAATLVHSFVSSRIDYCNAVLAGAPKVTTDKLQRVMNAAARVITGTHKFDRGLSRILHTELHWLDVPERVMFKLCILVHSCLHSQAPQYLVDLCLSVSDVASRQHLRSTSRRLWSFGDTGCERTADGLSLLLARLPGTRCLTI